MQISSFNLSDKKLHILGLLYFKVTSIMSQIRWNYPNCKNVTFHTILQWFSQGSRNFRSVLLLPILRQLLLCNHQRQVVEIYSEDNHKYYLSIKKKLRSQGEELRIFEKHFQNGRNCVNGLDYVYFYRILSFSAFICKLHICLLNEQISVKVLGFGVLSLF